MPYEEMEWQVYLITNQVKDKGYVGLTTGNQGVRLLDQSKLSESFTDYVNRSF